MVVRVPCLTLAKETMFSQCQDSGECQPSLNASNYTRVFIEQAMSRCDYCGNGWVQGPITSIPSICPLTVAF